MTNQKSKIIILIIGFLLFPVITFAATLYLEPSEGKYQLGDTFIVEIKLNTEGEYINTMKVNLTFPQEILEVKDFSKGNSVLTLWVEEPNFSNQGGTVSFTGGIPGGYLGEDGPSGRIIFKAKKEGKGEIQFQEDSQVLLNDGFGTEAELETQGVAFNILAEKLEVPKDEWLQELKKDNIPPEPFEIEIHQDSAIFEDKYFSIFSTTDKQTGLSHFELKEGERDWEKAESPYLLEDQSLKSIIKVKAVDKAGNERIAEYIPEIPKRPFLWWIIVIVLFGVLIIILIWKKYIKKH